MMDALRAAMQKEQPARKRRTAGKRRTTGEFSARRNPGIMSGLRAAMEAEKTKDKETNDCFCFVTVDHDSIAAPPTQTFSVKV